MASLQAREHTRRAHSGMRHKLSVRGSLKEMNVLNVRASAPVGNLGRPRT